MASYNEKKQVLENTRNRVRITKDMFDKKKYDNFITEFENVLRGLETLSYDTSSVRKKLAIYKTNRTRGKSLFTQKDEYDYSSRLLGELMELFRRAEVDVLKMKKT